MWNFQNQLINHERCRDLRREAERDQLVRQALASREKGRSLYYRVLTWVGTWLVVYGQRLQEHYHAADAVPRTRT